MWYQAFILALVALRILATDKDRNALNVILAASLVSTFLVHLVTHEISGAWKLAVPGAVEVLTIAALMQWTPNRTGVLQASCLFVAWSAHALCYLDIQLGTDIVYSRYETILALVAVAQILVCYDTLAHCGRTIAAGVASFFPGSGHGVRHAASCDRVPFGGAGSVSSANGRTEEAR